MAADLWGFRDAKDLERNIRDCPEKILKKQISVLGDKTGFVLYGKPLYMKVSNPDIKYKIATIFNVIVPMLDDYSKTLLIMYSNLKQNFPVAISVGRTFADDMEEFQPPYVCYRIEEFRCTLREILCSEEVMNTIRILYSKASMLGNYSAEQKEE